MSNKKRYRGIIIPAVTPLTDRFALDVEAVEKIFLHFHQYGCMPFIAGTTGESSSLPLPVKREYIVLAGKLRQPGMDIYAGISSNNLQESIDLANFAFDQGIDAVAATLPSYYVLTSDEMKRYFETLADRINGPMIIYNIPATTHMSIPLELIDELSRHEKIIGTKDSERSDERLQQSLEKWARREDFSHFLGWAARSAIALAGGSAGLIPSTGNLYPAVYKELQDSIDAADEEKANQCQALSDTLGHLYQADRTLGQSLWALKRLMQEEGLCREEIMPPLQPQSAQEANRLVQQWQQVKEQYSIKVKQV